MSETTENTVAPEATLLLVDIPGILKRVFGVRNPPPVSTIRAHAYDARFAYIRLPNGKLAVRQGDLKDIAALYAVRTGNIRTAA